jgi:hypothetical protein
MELTQNNISNGNLPETAEPNLTTNENTTGNISNDSPTAEQTRNWQDDKRYKEMWKQDPNNFYKSYKDLEKTLNEKGIKISEYQKKLDELNSKKTQYEQLTSYIESIEKHPEYSARFSTLIDEYNKEQKRKQYGYDLPETVIEKLDRVTQLEQYVQKQEEAKAIEAQGQIIDQQLNEIDSIAKKYGIDYERNDFINWCLDNQVLPKDMKAYFMTQALDKIEQRIAGKTQESVLKNYKINNQANLNSGDKNSAKSFEASLREQLDQILT